MGLPVYPFPGGVAGAEPPDPVAGASGHLTWSTWIKEAVKQLDRESTPVGAVIAYGGNTAPPGWHLCNGTAHGSTALATVLGSPNTPNLMDRFIIAAGASYGLGTIGGAATVALTEQQSGLRNHGHGATSGDITLNHSHATAQSLVYGPFNGVNQDADVSYRSSPTKYASLLYTTAGTDLGNSGHNHAITVDASGAFHANEAHENRPPYYALTYIIKK